MRSSLGRFLLAAVALLLCCATAARAAVLGIDYGSEYVKVSIVAPGRTPISIVINEISKRKSTAAVAFTGGDRWLAEEAMNYNARYPERVFTRLRDLLGKDASVESFAEYLAKYKLPYKVVRDADRGTARVVSETGDEYAVEELVAMILQYAMKIGEGMGKGQIKVRTASRTTDRDACRPEPTEAAACRALFSPDTDSTSFRFPAFFSPKKSPTPRDPDAAIHPDFSPDFPPRMPSSPSPRTLARPTGTPSTTPPTSRG